MKNVKRQNNQNSSSGNFFLLPIMIFAIIMFAISGCELIQGPDLSPPSDVSASTDLMDKIELSWTEVEKANIYYIYRSASKEGEYEYTGFTYAGTYTDTDIAPQIPYWYKVHASDIETNNESEGSTPAEGNSDHEFSWNQPVVAVTGAAQARLAIDTAAAGLTGNDRAYAYLASASNDETGAITVSKYDPTAGTFEQLGAAFGTTDIDSPRVFDIAAQGGSVYVAYSDKGLGGKVRVNAYSEAAGAWQPLGSEGFSTVTDARYLSVDVDPATGTVYVGYIYTSAGNYHIEIRKSTDFTSVEHSITAATPYSSIHLSYAGSLWRAYKDEGSGADAETIETNAPTNPQVISGVNLRDGYMDFIAVSASEMYIAYYTDALSVQQYDSSSWSTDLTPAGASAAVSAASVGLAHDASTGSLYLYYSDDGGGFGASGLVLQYSQSGWTTLTVDEDTDNISTAASSLELKAYNNIVYASYLTGGAATLRVWE